MVKTVCIAGVVVVALASLWFSLHMGEYDPKNFHYLCWKHGLCRMDPQRAVSVMFHDVNPEQIVRGKSKDELERKFGFLTSLDQASPYLQNCYRGSAYNGKEVVFLRHSDWMVVFENGVAAKLVLVKGC